MTLVSGNRPIIKVHADIRGGALGRGRQTTLGVAMTPIFGYLAGYVFENVRDTASNIT